MDTNFVPRFISPLLRLLEKTVAQAGNMSPKICELENKLIVSRVKQESLL